MSVLLVELIKKTNESINQTCYEKKKKFPQKDKLFIIMTVESQLVHQLPIR